MYQEVILVLCLCRTAVVLSASSDGFYFTVNPSDQDVEEGQPLRLRCAVTPSKDIYYSWLHNGDRVKLIKQHDRRYLEADSDMQIPHADRELDQGTYQCQALNRSSTFTSASQEAKVNIYWMDPDVQVRLVNPNRFEDIRLGQEVEFSCEAKANPPLSQANIKWYHNGNIRLPNTEFRRNGNLRIAALGMEHIGSYHCRVVHAAGKLDSRPPFVLQFNDASPPELITSLVQENFVQYVTRGRSVELLCPKLGSQETVDGIPPITVWGYMQFLGERQQPIASLPDIKLLDMDSKLVINNFDSHHVNYYTCEIGQHNSPEKYIFLFQLEMAVLYPPKRADFSPRLKKNQAYVVRINDDAELRYYSDQSPANSFLTDGISNPPPRIEWYKRGEHQPLPIWPPLDLSIHSDMSTRPRLFGLHGRHLVVEKVTEADSGQYEMILTNVAGRVTTVFDLLVTYPPEFYETQTREEHSLDEDSSIRLNCGIKRRTLPGSIVYWEKDQRVLKKHANSLMLLEDNGETLRFPKLKPEDQGQYQCFIQTEGYEKRAAGREQTLVVKAKLQFLRELREHFLELNTHGRVPCRARGYGIVKVDWFRKIAVGSHSPELQPIRAPKQVESDGTLVIQFVRKADAGDYVCIAQSSYKNEQINMSVLVVVGERPKISRISANQTVSVEGQLVLNCHATGDPLPQISWIAKRAGFVMYTPQIISPSGTMRRGGGGGGGGERMNQSTSSQLGRMDASNGPSLLPTTQANPEDGGDPVMAAIRANSMQTDTERVRAFSNGSLVISEASLLDQAEYICVANNKHAVETRRGLFVRVLSAEEYTRRQLGEDGSGHGMLRTIFTVVGCAVAYLGLIVLLTVFCSMRMVRTRRKRLHKTPKTLENGQLLQPLNESCGQNGTTQSTGLMHHQQQQQQQQLGSNGNALDPCFVLTSPAGSGASAIGSVSYEHMHSHPHATQPLLGTTTATLSSYPQNSTDIRLDPNAMPQTSLSSNGLGMACTPIHQQQQASPDWWAWNLAQGYFNPLEMQPKVPHGTPAGPLDLASESTVDSAGRANEYGLRQYPLNGTTPSGYLYNGRIPGTMDDGELAANVAANTTSATTPSSTMNATTASEPPIMSAPPPTPLDSRSHFSGLSSDNSTSLYSRSLLSGASNTGPASSTGPGQMGRATSPVYGFLNGNEASHQTNRMHYPRCELENERVLGKGAFGNVFLARARHIQDGETQSVVLVKSLASHESLQINEFHRQLELFGKLNHKNVARLLGICMEQEPFYMLLEYCEWGDLKMFLRSLRDGGEQHQPQPLQPIQPQQQQNTSRSLNITYEQKLKMCHQVSMGMEHLSQMRCVHRDLAARNILLTQNMDIKVSSLGLCRDVHATEYHRLPTTGQFIPLRWLAPELIAEALPSNPPSAAHVTQLDYGHSFTAPSLPYTVQSDVWAFAVLVCEVFTLATLPLARLTDQEIILAGRQTAMQAHEPTSGSETSQKTGHKPLRPDIPAAIASDLSSLLTKCWSPIARSRPEFREISAAFSNLHS